MAEYKPRADEGATPPPDMAAQRLRYDIDSGRTGDKIPFPDPAAAPLGTDAEAAGMRDAETAPPGAPHTGARYPEGHQRGSEIGAGKGLGVAVASMIVVVLVVLVVMMVAG
ncbi:MAG TPA: hypothetical protein VD978_17645 [Azospirillum sp.]|nr:hypothetical protein [Azospirillum sp.]